MTTENGFDHQEDIQDTREPPKKIMKIDEPEKIEKKPRKTTKNQIKDKKVDKSYYTPVFFMVILFIISIGFSLVLAPIFLGLNLQADFSEVGGEESLLIPFLYLAAILIFTAIILYITRKRRGRFIKYGFLLVIAISLSYVFFAIFSAIFFPDPPQEWSGELELDGDVSFIKTADLLEIQGAEIIIGTNQGYVYVFDNDLNQIWKTPANLPGTITDLEVADLNADKQPELVVVGKAVNIYGLNQSGTNYEFDLTWTSNDMNIINDFTAAAVVYNYQLGSGNYSTDNDILYLGYGSQQSGPGLIYKIQYSDNSYQFNNVTELPTPIFSIISGLYNDTNYKLYIGSREAIYSMDLTSNDQGAVLIKELSQEDLKGNISGLQISNIDDKNTNELVAWDDNGVIYIFESNKLRKRITDFEGKILGGVLVIELLDWLDGEELVVSSEGKVYIYYTSDKSLDNRWEFTEETGRLDKTAKGLAAGYIRDNDEKELLVGQPDNVKYYHYISPVYSDIPCIMGGALAIILSILLFKYPEWYLVDLIGIFVAAGVTALLGVSIGLLPLIVLLIIFAVYDAISVYKTKHMVSLADKVMEFKLPILLVVPKKRGYSFIQQKGLKKQLDSGEEREAMFIGLGDIIIPGTLVISSFTFLPVEVGVFGLGTNLLVALFTLVGILFGFSALMHFVLKGNPQAGLPLLNTGAILGFMISYVLIYQDFTFGMSWPFG